MNPLPPKTCVATRVAVTAASVEYSFAIAAACLTSATDRRPASSRSFSQAAL
jgi:hypothetical protein